MLGVESQEEVLEKKQITSSSSIKSYQRGKPFNSTQQLEDHVEQLS